ncbi:tetraacyldisaccharide 4'-kinase [Parapedobacter sp. DT-150]|uniref:tetraacyldisaccharide 4'-kinase n=1 Tax=Parapedobacter sp. DT-150 TaxID=3396162 RepID=UPI003F1C19CF
MELLHLTMAYLRLLLLPLSVLYGLAIWIRNRCYDWGWARSTVFDKPVIVVGNLAVGGTGKSPMIEYLLRILTVRYRVATLSRGYGRQTRGFLEVGVDDVASKSGDEPLQFKRKFPDVTVAVDENRVHGVDQLLQRGHDVILLDDAFQHRALSPGLAILLFDYKAMEQARWLLPAGNYRDSFGERRRADVMVVTKTPADATDAEKNHIRNVLATGRAIPVLFAGISYGALALLHASEQDGVAVLRADHSVLLLTGIANPAPLYDYLRQRVSEVVQLRYADHHRYTLADIRKIAGHYHSISNPAKLIVTTEKDAQRLQAPELADLVRELPIYTIPIQVQFDEEDEATLRQRVLRYCADTLDICI